MRPKLLTKFKLQLPLSPLNMRWSAFRNAGLGIAAMLYITVDYLRHISPQLHSRLQPALWSLLVIAAVARVPSYRHWSAEFRAAIPFVASMIFMLATLLYEAVSVRSVTAVLGLDWHRENHPLPDTGQWLFLALNEKLPSAIVDILRARIIGLHHYLMLFMMLAFSVLFDSVRAPGFGLGARYMFTMAIGRLLRTITFASTILPSPRPWCAASRFKVPNHPHRWAQKYYVPYTSDHNAISQVIKQDIAYVDIGKPIGDHRPDWGSMSFLIDFLRPTASEGSWFSLLTKAGGGCNDLLYSGHMLVAVLTAMAWTEAYGGFSSALVWLLVIHSAQREIRERHHYSVDCIVAIYVGILIWKMTGFIWSQQDRRPTKFEKIQSRLIQASKDSDIDKMRELLKETELSSEEIKNQPAMRHARLFSGVTIGFALIIVVLALILTSDG